MTKEPIMIDGVDVAECVFRGTNKLGNDIGTYCRCITGSCYDIHECYYKQLKRKEQECEKWKNNYRKSTAKMTIKEIDQSTYIKQLEKTINRIRTERDKYKQALQEIKEIAEETSKIYPTKTLNQILQKCEVIDD